MSAPSANPLKPTRDTALPSGKPRASAPPRSLLAGPWLAVIVGFVCFVGTLRNGFAYDDVPIVEQSTRVREPANLRAIWLTDWWVEPREDMPILDPGRDRLYRPLTLQSFALNYAIHGLAPFGFHLVNVLLHAAVCGLVWVFAQRLVGDTTVATIGAVLFAVHPVHAEAVAGIVGRAEVLSAMFMLLGLIALMPRGGWPSLSRTAAGAAAFSAALFAKETAICYPLVALLTLDFCRRWSGRGFEWRALLTRIGVLLAPLLVYLPLRFIALEQQFIRSQLSSVLFNPLGEVGTWGRVHGAFTILGHYVRLCFVPSTLSCDYGKAIFDPASGPEVLTVVGLIGAIAVVVLAARFRRSDEWGVIAYCSLAFAASYVLISNSVLLVGVSLAERLLYWPSVPLLIGTATGLVFAWRRARDRAQISLGLASLLKHAGAAMVIALALRSVMRSLDWRDNLTLFSADVATYPQGAHLNLGLAQQLVASAQTSRDPQASASLLKDADGLLARALEISPRFPAALQLRGVVARLGGDDGRAAQLLEAALRLEPGDRVAQALLDEIRGVGAKRAASLDAARAAVNANPQDAAARAALGAALIAVGKVDEALPEWENAVRLAPESAEFLRGCAEALALNFRNDEAIALLRKALTLDEGDWQLHANLAALLRENDPPQTLIHARRAVDLHPNDVRTQSNYAEALALNGQRDEAIRRFQMIIARLPAGDPMRHAMEDRVRELQR